MSIQKENNKFKLYCDVCYECAGEFDNFYGAVKFAKKENWGSVKVFDEWKNCCYDCLTKWREKNE